MTQPREFGFDEETGMLKDAAKRFFDEKQTLVQLRPQLEGSEDPYRGNERSGWYDEPSWKEMIELGWHLLAVPESAGGIGMGLVAAAAIQEEVGRAACPTPLTGTLQTTFVLRQANAGAALARVSEGASMALAIFGEEGSLELTVRIVSFMPYAQREDKVITKGSGEMRISATLRDGQDGQLLAIYEGPQEVGSDYNENTDFTREKNLKKLFDSWGRRVRLALDEDHGKN